MRNRGWKTRHKKEMGHTCLAAGTRGAKRHENRNTGGCHTWIGFCIGRGENGVWKGDCKKGGVCLYAVVDRWKYLGGWERMGVTSKAREKI